MAEGQMDYIQKKAQRLRTCLTDVKERLQSEYEHTWGEEQTQEKQNLLQRKAFLEERLDELQKSLDELMKQRKQSSSFTIQIGDRTREVMIVSSTYAAPNKGYISSDSPLGRALKSISIGESFDLKTPKGKQNYKLLAVR